MYKKGGTVKLFVGVMLFWALFVIGLTYIGRAYINYDDPLSAFEEPKTFNSFEVMWKILTFQVDSDKYYISVIFGFMGLLGVAITYFAARGIS